MNCVPQRRQKSMIVYQTQVLAKSLLLVDGTTSKSFSSKLAGLRFACVASPLKGAIRAVCGIGQLEDDSSESLVHMSQPNCAVDVFILSQPADILATASWISISAQIQFLHSLHCRIAAIVVNLIFVHVKMLQTILQKFNQVYHLARPPFPIENTHAMRARDCV